MNTRSKSESSCFTRSGTTHLDTSSCSLQRRSYPFTLNKEFNHNNIIDDILTSRSNVTKSDSNADDVLFLQSKLYAALDYIKRLEGSSSTYWNEDKIREVSAAMKQYISETETNTENLNAKIKQLEQDISKLNAENTKTKDDNDKIISLKYEKERKCLEKQYEVKIFDLNQELTLKSNEIEKLTAKNIQAVKDVEKWEMDSIMKENEHKLQEGSLIEEIENLRQKYEVLQEAKSMQSEEIIKHAMQLSTLQAEERKLQIDRNELKQELQREKHKSAEYQMHIQHLEISNYDIQKENEMIKTKLLHMSEIEKIATRNIQTETNDSNKKITDELLFLKTENTNLKVELQKLQYALEKEEEKVKELKSDQENNRQVLKDNEEIISNLQHELKLSAKDTQEYVNSYQREIKHELEQQLQLEVRRLNEEKTRQERGLTEEKKGLCAELEKSNNTCSQLAADVEDLKEKLHKQQLENQKTLLQSQNKQDQSSIQMKNLENENQMLVKERELFEQRNVELQNLFANLTSEIEEKNKRMKDSEIKRQQLIEQLRENDGLKKEIEILKDKYDNTMRQKNEQIYSANLKCKELKERYEAEKNRNLEIQQLLEIKNQKLSKYIENAHKHDGCSANMKNLQEENKELHGTLHELKILMQNAREELENLRNKSVYDEEFTKQLKSANEKLEKENSTLEKSLQLVQADVRDFDDQIMKIQRDKNILEDELLKFQQTVMNLEVQLASSNDQVKLSDSVVKKHKNALAAAEIQINELKNELSYYREQCYGLVENIEQVQLEYHQSQKSSEENELISNDLKKEIEKLSKEKQSRDDKMLTLKNEIETLGCKFKKIQEDLHQSNSQLTMTREQLCSSNNETNQLRKVLNASETSMKEQIDSKIIIERKLQELSNQYENLQRNHTHTMKELKDVQTNLQEKTAEFENMKNEKLKYEISLKENETRLAHQAENLEGMKLKNSQLLSQLQILQDKEKENKTEFHNTTLSFKDIQNEVQMLHKEITAKSDEISNLKGQIKEFQGVIDGSKSKHEWIIKNEKEQIEEMKFLKQTVCELQIQLLQAKEQHMRFTFEVEKLKETLSNKDTELNKLHQDLNLITTNAASEKRNMQNKLKMYELELSNLLDENKDLTKLKDNFKNDISINEREKQELNASMKTLEERNNSITLESVQLKKEVMKLENMRVIAEEKIVALRGELIKLIYRGKEILKERDSLKAILETKEEENFHCQKCNAQLKVSIERLQNELNNSNHEKQQAYNEQEIVKSRLSILKYAESARLRERDEILDKLKDAEKKIQNLSKESQSKEETQVLYPTQVSSPASKAVTANFLDFHLKSPNISNSRTKVKFNQENRRLSKLKELEEYFQRKESGKDVPCRVLDDFTLTGRNINKKKIRKDRKGNKSSKSSEQLAKRLCDESQNLQSTLLNEMKSLRNKLSTETL